MIRLDPAETIDVSVPQAGGEDWVLKVPTLTGRAYARLCRDFDALDESKDGEESANRIFSLVASLCENVTADEVADRLTWRQTQQLIEIIMKANQPNRDDLGKSA